MQIYLMLSREWKKMLETLENKWIRQHILSCIYFMYKVFSLTKIDRQWCKQPWTSLVIKSQAQKFAEYEGADIGEL